MPSKILVVDDLSLSRIILSAKLSSACYETILAPTGQAALDLARTHLPDLVLMDCSLPDIDGPEVCVALRADPLTAHIPVILFSADSSREMRLNALASGADDFLPKPLDEAFLMSRLRAVLRMSATGQDHRKHMSPALRIHLSGVINSASPAGHVALICSCPGLDHDIGDGTQDLYHSTLDLPSVLNKTRPGPMPDVLLLTPEIINIHGIHIISELRSRPQTRHLPIVVLLPADMRGMRGIVLDLGAEDVLCLPLDPQEARMRLDTSITRKKWADAMRQGIETELGLASRDPLTGLFNRRHATSRLTELVTGAEHTRINSFALLLIDLDNFKRVNDTFGHLAGDDVLKEVARRMRAAVRSDDLLARYGGEEFLLALPDVSAQVAHQMAERIRKQIEGEEYSVRQGAATLQVTASIGVTVHTLSDQCEGDMADGQIASIIDQADQALHTAKSCGRNQVSLGFCAVA